MATSEGVGGDSVGGSRVRQSDLLSPSVCQSVQLPLSDCLPGLGPGKTHPTVVLTACFPDRLTPGSPALQLFPPNDEQLEKFWIDFNTSSECVSFFVDNPQVQSAQVQAERLTLRQPGFSESPVSLEGFLWGSIHLLREEVRRYSFQLKGDGQSSHSCPGGVCGDWCGTGCTGVLLGVSQEAWERRRS